MEAEIITDIKNFNNDPLSLFISKIALYNSNLEELMRAIEEMPKEELELIIKTAKELRKEIKISDAILKKMEDIFNNK